MVDLIFSLSRGCCHILAATEYFSRWAEIVPFKMVIAEVTLMFVTNNIMRQFGIPYRIQSDNGANFKNDKVYKFTKKYKINWQYSTIYNQVANGLA